MISKDFPNAEINLDAAILKLELQAYQGLLASLATAVIFFLKAPDIPIKEIKARFCKPDASLDETSDAIRKWRRTLRMPTLRVGCSRVGGWPDLPVEITWPTDHNGEKMQFVAQIDLNELPQIPGYPLPECGWLYVFVDQSKGMPPLNRVIHFAGTMESLVRTAAPRAEELAPDDCRRREVLEVSPVKEFQVSYALPMPLSDVGSELLAPLEQDGDAIDRYEKLSPAPRRPHLMRMFGCGGIDGQNPPVAFGEKSGDDWMLLLQVTGNSMWGESNLQVYIRRSALERQDFSDCYSTLDP